ncbi:alpha-L-fucosidase 1 [Perilla frutescens var. hirtella]|uniref:alpha-L-fucosidase n=1 Tax=Perilla frutescens var. hirtella TaxID=608512 RepID=A0AAD4P757_PERFH|nr:alpha-L-fucosidase 1 [Perilla frutescens var. hirtella]
MPLLYQMTISIQDQTTPPLPIPPLPSYSQLDWQQREMIMFLHFGVNTFTGREWGTGHESPSVFNPTGLNASQWADAAARAGFSLMILTAKHHDGFCLWPSRYTDHSVIGSPWKNGSGDVVREFVDAAKARAIDVGFYLSPWDMHDPRYGNEKLYNEYYMAQLQELLTWYGGDIREIWFDGAKGSNAPNMSYHFKDWFSMVKELQSTVNIFSDAGPDVRWVGNERGSAGRRCWSTINATSITIGNVSSSYLNTGDPKGTNWVPAECDVSIRKGWFWHKSESPKKLSKLLKIYYSSVGRNCVLLLNVPPNSTGLISESDVQILQQFRGAIDTIFSTNYAEECSVQASSQRGGETGGFGPINVLDNDHLWTYWAPSEDRQDYWIEFKAKSGKIAFNVIRIQEAIGLGQRIEQHEIYVDGNRVVKGSTIGYKRLHKLEMGGLMLASSVRINIVKAKGTPLISSIGLHFDPF